MGETGAVAQAPLPARFGKYTVLGHLATGGMAEVYLARAAGIEGFEKIVVIKRIKPELIGDKSTTEMFLHEARLAATLQHPNIAQVHEIGIVNDSYFFAMEFVHGADLRQVLEAAVKKGKTIPLADAVHIAIRVCEALHYAHEQRDFDGNPLGIIHRDVSPSNVLISHDGAVKVCDFGIAKATTGGRQTETVRGVVKGKYAYMSPEQCQANPIDRRSDIFTIGILLYESSTLTRLFEGKSDFDVMKSVIEKPAVVPPSVRPDFPPALQQIILKALAKNPAERYATAQELQLDLEAFARDQRLAMSSVSVARLMASLFEGRTRAWEAAKRAGKGLGEHLLERGERNSYDSIELAAVMLLEDGARHDSATPVPVQPWPEDPGDGHANDRTVLERPRAVAAPRRPSYGWLVAALAALALGASAFAFERHTRGEHQRALVDGLSTEAAAIAGTLDGELRAAQLRADGFASAPILRAAIETDAATLADMIADNAMFAPKPGEVLELYQIVDGAPAQVLRVPADAPAIPRAARGTGLEPTAGKLTLIVSAPITRQRSEETAGEVVMYVPVQCGPIRTRLAARYAGAWLTGLGQPVTLAGEAALPADAAALTTVPLAAAGTFGGAPLALAAALPPSAQAPWLLPSLLGAGILAAVMLILFAASLRRKA
jgi:tRNA A-37 threonylcarbamoyl transferase component Bud32